MNTAQLSDPLHCQRLRDALSDLGVQWQVREASPTLQRILPRSPGLYMFVWEPYFRAVLATSQEVMFPEVLYVGRAGDSQSNNTLQARYAEYAQYLSGQLDEGTSGRRQRLTNLFQRKRIRYWFARVDDRSKLRELEGHLIDLFDPPGNIQRSRPRMRRKATVPAF